MESYSEMNSSVNERWENEDVNKERKTWETRAKVATQGPV